jgi:hypothetical protein
MMDDTFEKIAGYISASELIGLILVNSEFRDYHFGQAGDEFFAEGGFDTLLKLISTETDHD